MTFKQHADPITKRVHEAWIKRGMAAGCVDANGNLLGKSREAEQRDNKPARARPYVIKGSLHNEDTGVTTFKMGPGI